MNVLTHEFAPAARSVAQRDLPVPSPRMWRLLVDQWKAAHEAFGHAVSATDVRDSTTPEGRAAEAAYAEAHELEQGLYDRLLATPAPNIAAAAEKFDLAIWDGRDVEDWRDEIRADLNRLSGFGLDIRDPLHPDHAIGVGLLRWADLVAEYVALPGDGPDDTDPWSDGVQAAEESLTPIYEVSATTPEGEAIQTYLALRDAIGPGAGCELGIDLGACNRTAVGGLEDVIERALSRSPLLAALIAGSERDKLANAVTSADAGGAE